MILGGTYPFPSADSVILLSDGAGEVVAVGDDVLTLKKGDRVSSLFFDRDNRGRGLGGNVPGVLAQYQVFDETSVLKFPSHLSYEEASTLACAAVTAYTSLFEVRPIQAGETVLLQGTGGVSIFGLQLAKAAGARVIITSSSDEKIKKAKELGADDGINYSSNPNWAKAAKELTNGRGVDHIIDLGSADTLGQSIAAIGEGGHISLVGALTGKTESTLDLFGPMLAARAMIRGIYVGVREDFVNLNKILEFHKIKPLVDKVFPFAEAPAAYKYLQGQKHVGKVVIKIE